MAKTIKKTFSDGLQDMFQRTLFEDNPQDNPMLFAHPEHKKKHTKSFTDNLESFFQDAIEDVIQEKAQELRAEGIKTSDKSSKKSNKKPNIGLDLLIRNTIEEGVFSESDKKRITFTFEKEKIERLKKVADLEKTRIRDIIDELVTGYIKKYKLS